MNSDDKINYVIISSFNKIGIIDPFDEKKKINYVYKDNENLIGRNYAYSIIYNFKDNNDYLLSYKKYNMINIINLNLKIIVYTIDIGNTINSALAWNTI